MKRVLIGVCLLATMSLAAARVILASSVIVRQSVAVSNGSATVTLEVRNVTGGTIQNVDVRLVQPQSDVLPKGVVQFGTLMIRQARSASTPIVLRAGSQEPFVWQVDYDDAAGHHSESIPGTK